MHQVGKDAVGVKGQSKASLKFLTIGPLLRPFLLGQTMAAELLTDASRALDANANPYSGAKWSFYQSGTSTPQSVYTTSALNTTHSNPVEADAGGKFAPIYFDSSLQYRGVLKSADEVTTIYDIDLS